MKNIKFTMAEQQATTLSSRLLKLPPLKGVYYDLSNNRSFLYRLDDATFIITVFKNGPAKRCKIYDKMNGIFPLNTRLTFPF